MTPFEVSAAHRPAFFSHGFLTGQHVANDNSEFRITGDLYNDLQVLKKKWGASELEVTHFVDNLGYFAQDAIHGLYKRAHKLMTQDYIKSADMIATAVCMGLCNALFSYLKQLPQEETIFVLEEIARKTDAIVKERK